MKKGKRRLFCVGLLLSVMVVSLISPVFAEESHENQVRVIIENTTFLEADPKEGIDEPPWTGVLIDTWVEIDSDKATSNDTMMTCVKNAIENEGYTQTGAENNYISEINGLSEFDGGTKSGWMGTLNDWFTNEGFDNFTVKSGKLEVGDEIRIMYTCDYGEDIAGSWTSTDKTLKNLEFSVGTLSPAFDKDTKSYTLTVPSKIKTVKVTPTAANKNYQVRTSVGETTYKRTADVPVSNGTVITVKDGDPTWPSMSDNTGEAQIYTITVRVDDTALLMGDANEDGEITIADVNAIQLQLAKLGNLTTKGNLQADVNGDSKVTIDDGNRIQLYLAKIIKEL